MRVGQVRRISWILLLLLCLGAFTVNLLVIARDRVGDVYDPMHLERTGRLLAHAVRGEPGAWEAYRQATAASAYPPLIHWVSLPVRLAAGDVPRAGAVAVALWSVLTILAAFSLANLLGGDRAGLLAALFTASAPGLYRFSRMEMVDAPLAAMVSLAIFFLFYSDGLRRRRHAVGFSLMCCLGLLTKQSFPLYVAAPVIYVIGQELWLDNREARRRRIINLVIAGLLALIILGAAFFPTLGDWLDARETVRSFYLRHEEASFIDNLKLLITDGLGPILAVLAFLGIVTCRFRDRSMRGLLLWLIPPLTVLHAVYGMLSTRYLLPLLPAATVLAALGIERILTSGERRKYLARAVLVVLLVLAAVTHDHLRRDEAAFTFASFEKRLHLQGIPRPAELGWSIKPVADSLNEAIADRHIVMLSDTPYTSLLQNEIWLRHPQAQITNLFEMASTGRLPPEFAPKDALVEFLGAADYLLIKTDDPRDVQYYNYSRDVDVKFAQRVFAAFYRVKGQFEFVNHFAYPEGAGPLRVYKRLPDGQVSPPPEESRPPDESRPALRSAPVRQE